MISLLQMEKKLILLFLLYLFAGQLPFFLKPRLRALAFAAVNVSFCVVVLFLLWHKDPILFNPLPKLLRAAGVVAGYLGLVSLQWALIRRFANSERGLAGSIPLVFPIVAMVAIKTVPVGGQVLGAALFVGISFMAFRLSGAALEVRTGRVERVGLAELVGHSLFLPTLFLGPISPLERTVASLRGRSALAESLAPAGLRIAVGLAKYLMLAALFERVSFPGSFVTNDRPFPWTDVMLASSAYFLYLYFNFSGFCDVVIGSARLVGIQVRENFDNPFLARNVRDFWNRWHITLSEYLRDLVFSPLSRSLTRVLGPANVNHAVAISIGTVFVLIGLWHGFAVNFVLFGTMHALGVVANHYYTLFLKRRLSREKFKAYNESAVVRRICVVATFVYVSSTFVLFANHWDELVRIARALAG